MNAKIVMIAAVLVGALSMWGLTTAGPAQPEPAPPPAPAPAHHDHGTRVSVTAMGRVTATPNRVTVSIGKVAEAALAADAIAQVNATMNELIDQLKALDLPGAMIQTSAVQVWPQYGQNRSNEEPRIVGYQASNTVSVRTDDIERVGEVFDLATKAGANQIHGPMFALQNPERAQRGALRNAVAEAKEKARAIADEMGMTIVRFEEIRESGAEMPRPMYAADAMAMRGAEAATPVEAGEIETTASVTLVARLGGGEHGDDAHGEHDGDE